MEHRHKRSGTTLGVAGFELLLGFPLYAVVPAYLLSGASAVGWLLIILLCAFAGVILARVLSGRSRFFLIISIACVCFVASLGLWGINLLGILSLVGYGAAAGRGVWMEQRGVSTLSLWLAAALAAVGAVIYPHYPELHPYAGVEMAAGIVLLLTAFIVSNRNTLQVETLSRSFVRLPSSVRRMNRVVLSVLLVLVVIVSLIKPIGDAIRTFLRSVVVFVFWLMDRLSPPSSEANEKPVQTQPQDLSGLGKGEASAFWRTLEKILLAGFTVFLAIAAVVLIILLIRGIRLLVKKLLRYMSQTYEGHGQEEEDGYVDEWTRLEAQGKRAKGSFLDRFRRSGSGEPAWETLSDREKIRLLYRRLILNWRSEGARIDPAWTPQEAARHLSGSLAQAEKTDRLIRSYEAVRYGEKDPEPGVAEQLRRELPPKS